MKSSKADDLIEILKDRFEKNMHRHKGIAWTAVQEKLERNVDVRLRKVVCIVRRPERHDRFDVLCRLAIDASLVVDRQPT